MVWIIGISVLILAYILTKIFAPSARNKFTPIDVDSVEHEKVDDEDYFITRFKVRFKIGWGPQESKFYDFKGEIGNNTEKYYNKIDIYSMLLDTKRNEFVNTYRNYTTYYDYKSDSGVVTVKFKLDPPIDNLKDKLDC